MTIESRLAEIRARVEAARKHPVAHATVAKVTAPALLAAVEAVMALHKCLTFPDDGIGEPTACGHCDNETWPCPTIRALTAPLEVEG